MSHKQTYNDPNLANSPEFSKYQKSRILAEKVLEIADFHTMPPKPKAYEVLYTYAGGENRRVVEQIDRIIDVSGVLNLFDVDQIYYQHFSPAEKQRRQNDKTNDVLKKEIESILQLLSNYANCSKEFEGRLDSSIKNLAGDITRAQLKDTIEILLADNRRMRTEAKNLTGTLECSKAQMIKMGEELAEARKAALVDGLTGIGNRSWLNYKIEDCLEESRKTSNQFCVIFMDIDHFKRINDDFGHSAGDQVLRFFGSLLLEHVEDNDLCVRFGGEEFVIIFPDSDLSAAAALAEKIRASVQASKLIFTSSKQPLGEITASFGIARSKAGDTLDYLLERADKQLYKAKNSGRNCVMVET